MKKTSYKYCQLVIGHTYCSNSRSTLLQIYQY